MKTINFDTIEEHEDYLDEIFPYIAQDMEYNIFIHCVTSRSKYFLGEIKSVEDDVKNKVESIMRCGLNLDGTQGYGSYGSINGTAKFYGNSKEVDSSDIIDYDYFSMSKQVNSIIIAIPKYIEINGEMVEFSSYNGIMKHSSQHVKDCLFDVVKGSFLPIEFVFAHQMVDKENGKVVLNLNEKHLSNLSEDEKEQLLKRLSDKCLRAIERCKEKYGTDDMEELFEHKTEEHMIAIDDYLNEP